jgi:hypothetical protein
MHAGAPGIRKMHRAANEAGPSLNVEVPAIVFAYINHPLPLSVRLCFDRDLIDNRRLNVRCFQ